MTWPIPLSAIGRRAPGRPGGHLIGKPPLPKLSSQRTLRWRGVDSNHQFRESRHRCPHVDFSVEAAELVDLVGDWALTFAAATCDLVRCRSRSGRHDETRAELRPGLYRAMADHRDVRVGRDRPGRIGARYLQWQGPR